MKFTSTIYLLFGLAQLSQALEQDYLGLSEALEKLLIHANSSDESADAESSQSTKLSKATKSSTSTKGSSSKTGSSEADSTDSATSNKEVSTYVDTEPDYEYVDVYGCNKVDVNSTDDLHSKYGCVYDASVSYYLNLGQVVYNNLTYIMENNKTYQKNYKAYVRSIQQSILSEFGQWMMKEGGIDFYHCKNKKSVSKCYTLKEGNIRNLCYGTISKMNNMDIDPKNYTLAAKKLSDFYNLTINATDLGQITSGFDIPIVDNAHCTFEVHNVTAPAAGNLIPDPMEHVHSKNLTDLKTLLSLAKNGRGEVSPLEIFDSLIPVPVYAQLSTSVMYINEQGDKVRKLEAKERKLRILNIITGFFGVLAAFLPGVQAIVFTVIVDLVNVLGTFAIDGWKPDGASIGSVVLICVLSIFELSAAGRSISEVSQMAKLSRGAGYMSKMTSFKEFKNVIGKIFNVSSTTVGAAASA